MKNHYAYTIYDFGTNELIVEGSSNQCADALGISRGAFYSLVHQNQDAKSPRYKIDIKGEKRKYPKSKGYIVYDNLRNVLAKGSASECAEALGMSLHTFYSTVTRVKKGQNRRYIIENK